MQRKQAQSERADGIDEAVGRSWGRARILAGNHGGTSLGGRSCGDPAMSGNPVTASGRGEARRRRRRPSFFYAEPRFSVQPISVCRLSPAAHALYQQRSAAGCGAALDLHEQIGVSTYPSQATTARLIGPWPQLRPELPANRRLDRHLFKNLNKSQTLAAGLEQAWMRSCCGGCNTCNTPRPISRRTGPGWCVHGGEVNRWRFSTACSPEKAPSPGWNRATVERLTLCGTKCW